MKEYRKRDDTFRYLRSLKAQVICIQEHNCPDNEHTNWEKEWGGKIFWSAHNATLLANNLSASNVQTAAEGRILQTDIKLGNTQVTITNIYGPSYATEKRLFYRDFPDLQAQPFYIVVEDLRRYSRSYITRQNITAPLEYVNGLAARSYRSSMYFSPEEHITTHTQKAGAHLIQTRIDHILVSAPAVQTASKPSIQHAPYSDHKALIAHFQLQKNTRSKGVWKLNNTLLQEEAFRKNIAKVINSSLE